jgi:hypothetical protein
MGHRGSLSHTTYDDTRITPPTAERGQCEWLFAPIQHEICQRLLPTRSH